MDGRSWEKPKINDARSNGSAKEVVEQDVYQRMIETRLWNRDKSWCDI